MSTRPTQKRFPSTMWPWGALLLRPMNSTIAANSLLEPPFCFFQAWLGSIMHRCALGVALAIWEGLFSTFKKYVAACGREGGPSLLCLLYHNLFEETPEAAGAPWKKVVIESISDRSVLRHIRYIKLSHSKYTNTYRPSFEKNTKTNLARSS